jgi:CDP-glucose 4,6-dehydratase
MHVLITGHTGFKGAWLSLLLSRRGHDVSGIALDPLPGSLFEAAGLSELMKNDVRLDIRDATGLSQTVAGLAPDFVMHLAAQPLVRESYRDPRGTFETNVNGTLNVLEAIQETPTVQGALIVTTDKVYRNVGQREGYVEGDALGGDDPYSASKAMADILTQSWVKSFPGAPTAIARAGNVIGGGDVSKDRLLVDLIAGYSSGRPVPVRSPDSVRPWQHVLDCLNGYLMLTEALLDGRGAGEWNFGPDPASFQTVRTLADVGAAHWGDGASWVADVGDHPHEAALLSLDSTKAQSALGWHDILPFPTSLEWTMDWHRRVNAGAGARETTVQQIEAYEGLASGTRVEDDVRG